MPSQHLRCVFVTVSPLLSVILAEALSRRVELKLLAEFNERAIPAHTFAALAPDLVVVGLGPQESDEIGASLLAQRPKAKILLISAEGDYAYLYEMHSDRKVLFDFSPDALLAALFESDGSAQGPESVADL